MNDIKKVLDALDFAEITGYFATNEDAETINAFIEKYALSEDVYKLDTAHFMSGLMYAHELTKNFDASQLWRLSQLTPLPVNDYEDLCNFIVRTMYQLDAKAIESPLGSILVYEIPKYGVFIHMTQFTKQFSFVAQKDLTPKSKRALKKYGAFLCVKAYYMNEIGYGAKSIGESLQLHTNAVDSIIDVGSELM